MAFVIHKNNLAKLIKSFAQERDVWVPVKDREELSFQMVDKNISSQNFDFQTALSTLPPKFLFLPPEEKMFEINQGKIKAVKKPEPFFVFISYHDMIGISELDEVMYREPADYFYTQRRAAATMVVIVEGGVKSAMAGDLILEKADKNFYRAIVLTAKGKKMIKNKFFEQKELEFQQKDSEISDLGKLLLDSELLKDAVLWSRGHPIWEELAEVCLGCGICTYVCPLCYCFSVSDKKSFDGSRCSRCRQWDACTLPDFALVAGGKNFRATLKERYYNWYYHKFVRGYKEFGRPHCVACGRCTKYCPAGIDIYKVLSRIVGDYKKSQR